jgi:anti-sigma factor RsiW
MTCQELVELVTGYFDDALDAPTRAAFEEHVGVCPGCELYLEQMRVTVRLAGDLPALEQRPEVAALLDAFRGWRAESP